MDARDPAHHRVLLVEDDHQLAGYIRNYLEEDSLTVTHCREGQSALEFALAQSFDLILLDVMLPGMSGLDICHAVRKQDPMVPIVMITALDTEADRILGLDQGADDYLVKPFSVRELLARVRAQLRKARSVRNALNGDGANGVAEADRTLRAGELTLHLGRKVLQINDKTIPLTAKEFELLQFLMQHPDVVFSRRQLLDSVWGYSYDGYQHTVNSHINRLRMKIEPDQAKPRYILTAWGHGYQFAAHPTD